LRYVDIAIILFKSLLLNPHSFSIRYAVVAPIKVITNKVGRVLNSKIFGEDLNSRYIPAVTKVAAM